MGDDKGAERVNGHGDMDVKGFALHIRDIGACLEILERDKGTSAPNTELVRLR